MTFIRVLKSAGYNVVVMKANDLSYKVLDSKVKFVMQPRER